MTPKTWRDLGEIVPRGVGICFLVGAGLAGYIVPHILLAPIALAWSILVAGRWLHDYPDPEDTDDGTGQKPAEAFVELLPLVALFGYLAGWFAELQSDALTLLVVIWRTAQSVVALDI